MMIFLKNHTLYEPLYYNHNSKIYKTYHSKSTMPRMKNIYNKIIKIIKNPKNCYIDSDNILKQKNRKLWLFCTLKFKRIRSLFKFKYRNSIN